MAAKALTLGVVALLVLAIAGPVQAGSVQTSDGTFDTGDWSLQTSSIGNGGSVNASNPLTGGNPDAYRRVADVVSKAPSSSTFSAILGAHIFTPFTYNPSSTGAITGIDYSEDANCFLPNCFGDGQAAFLALSQNGKTYVRSLGVTGSSTSWHSLSANGLTALNFVQLDGSDDFVDGSSHPDFTAGGDPIQFGFARANSTCNGCNGYTLDAGIDNWHVVINFQDEQPPPTNGVPAPATLALLGTALGALGTIRRILR